MKTIFAICGSTRNDSANARLIQAIGNFLPENFVLNIWPNIDQIPHFNPDLDSDQQSAPEVVSSFRTEIKTADAILMCTPEYAMGLPGSFKNALDWTVSSASLTKKPTWAIVAAVQGEKTFSSLEGILQILEVEPIMQLISYVGSKVNKNAEIIEEETLEALQKNLTILIKQIESSRPF